jgi:transcriptional regulator
MYTPAHFHNPSSDEIRELIRNNSFGIIISFSGRILATHIPLELSADGKSISGHLSKANPQAKLLREGDEVLCVFSGPHTYISSSWYDHENVPTWNYIAAQARGKVRIISGDELYRRLVDIVDKYEAASEHPVSVQGMSPDYVDKHIKGIVAFDIEIEELEASYKLSQNRDKKNYQRIVDALEKRGVVQSSAIAEEMKKRTPKS